MIKPHVLSALALTGAALGCGTSPAGSSSSMSSAAKGATISSTGVASSSRGTSTGSTSAGSTGTSGTSSAGSVGTVNGSSTSASTAATTTTVGSTSSTARSSGTGAATSGTSGSSGSSGCAAPAGTTYYVNRGAANASDSNPGTSSEPWATLQQAGAVVQAGDTVIVMPGTYAGAIFGWDSPSPGDPLSTIAGTASAPITLLADPSSPPGSVIIGSANAQTPTGLDLEPGCDYVNLVGFSVTNDGSITKSGIKVAGSKGN